VCEELMVKEGNTFIVTNLLDAKVGSEEFLQEPQRGPLQPDKEVEMD
jgi:hypothetical protein